MKFFSTIFTTLTLCVAALAAPLDPGARSENNVLVVVDPKILEPNAKTTWVVGNDYTVTWDLSSIPPLANITNVVGRVVLGQFNGDGMHLYIDNPLATGFLLTNGQVKITVPKVPDGNYMIVLFGDSGNTSPQFKIVNNPLSSILSGGGTSQTPTPTKSTSTPLEPTPPSTTASSSVETSPLSASTSGTASSTAPGTSSTSGSFVPSSEPFTFSAPSTVSGSTASPSPSSAPSSSVTAPPSGGSANGAMRASPLSCVAWLSVSAMTLVLML